jgi:hypothetical protein
MPAIRPPHIAPEADEVLAEHRDRLKQWQEQQLKLIVTQQLRQHPSALRRFSPHLGK